jgi:hypothetical protein
MCRTGRRQNRHFGNLGFLNCYFFSFNFFCGRGRSFGFGNHRGRLFCRDKDRLAAGRQGLHNGCRRRGFRPRNRGRYGWNWRNYGFLFRFLFFGRFFDFFLHHLGPKRGRYNRRRLTWLRHDKAARLGRFRLRLHFRLRRNDRGGWRDRRRRRGNRLGRFRSRLFDPWCCRRGVGALGDRLEYVAGLRNAGQVDFGLDLVFRANGAGRTGRGG